MATSSSLHGNKRFFWIASSIWFLLVSVSLPCHAFASVASTTTSEFSIRPRQQHLEQHLDASGRTTRRISGGAVDPSTGATTNSLYRLRGGALDSNPLSLGLSDYSEAARGLFGNIIGPASMITGGLVPLGFLAEPLPGEKKMHKRLRSLYLLISVFSLANELMAIVYATVASNKLIETTVAPAASVFALLQRDFELSWVATNVHFMAGLFGFISMVCLRCFALLPSAVNKAGAGLAASFLLGMFSVVNHGIDEGNRAGNVFGHSVPGLALRYTVMLVRNVKTNGGPLAMAAILLGLSSTAVAVKAIVQEQD